MRKGRASHDPHSHQAARYADRGGLCSVGGISGLGLGSGVGVLCPSWIGIDAEFTEARKLLQALLTTVVVSGMAYSCPWLVREVRL